MAYDQFAYVYDRLMQEVCYPDWLRFLRECWSKTSAPHTIAELGCGTGNLTIPLAQMGYRMFGIDDAENMLAIAAEKSAHLLRRSSFASGGSVMWLKQDMREWSVDRPVDAVISFCDSINYLLEPEDVLATFRQTWKGLRPGGKFMFDVHTPGQLRSYAAEQPFVLNEEDIAYIWTCDWDNERCQIEHELTVFIREQQTASGPTNDRFARIEETHVQRAYELAWLREALQETGFTEIECVADFRWEAPTDKSQRAFFIATKGECSQ